MGAPALSLDDLQKLASGPSPTTSPAPGKSLSLSDLDALASGPPTPESHEDTFSNALHEYGSKMDAAVRGVTAPILHPVDTYDAIKGGALTQGNQNLFDKAKAAWKDKDYTGAAAHALSYFLNGIPGLGTALDEAGEKFKSGKTKEAIADTAALATQLGAGAKLPEITAGVGTAADTAPKVGGALLEGAKAAGPDVLAGGAKVAAGSVLPKVPGLSYGLEYQGGKQALSGLKKGVEAFRGKLSEAPQSMPAPEGSPTPAVTADDPAILDGLAKSLAKRPFNKLSPLDQQAIRTIAAKGQTSPPANTVTPPVQAQPVAPPVPPQAPTVTPPVSPSAPPPAAAAPVSDLEQQLTDSLANAKKPSIADVPKFKGTLRDLMRDLSGEHGKAVADANYAGNQDPEIAGHTYEAANRNVKAIQAAKMLHEAGLGEAEAAAKLKKLGFSADTIGETLFRLKRMAAQ